MKIIAITLAASTLLAACTPDMMMRARADREGNQEDVRFCRYEASKATVGGYTTRSAFGNALEEQDRQAQVFNACMQYRAGR